MKRQSILVLAITAWLGVVPWLSGAVFAGSLVAWGRNDWGECNVPQDADFIAIAAGLVHSVALRADGSITAWEDNNDYGQCDVPDGNDFMAITTGAIAFHSLAILTPESGPLQTLTVGVEPNDFDIDTVTPSIGQHVYYQYQQVYIRASRKAAGLDKASIVNNGFNKRRQMTSKS